MGFSRTSTHVSVPTHLKWIVQNPEKVGETFDIVTIFRNSEWKTVTFFSDEFKFNLKLDSAEEYEETYNELQKSFRRGFVKATLTDKTDLENKIYTCSINIESVPESKGGRKYEINKNRWSIDPRKDSVVSDE